MVHMDSVNEELQSDYATSNTDTTTTNQPSSTTTTTALKHETLNNIILYPFAHQVSVLHIRSSAVNHI